MNVNDDYEKIALSKQDLKFVYGQIVSSTISKLDLHLPEKNNDPMKDNIANLLDEFIVGGFDLLKYALIVDGIDMSHESDRESISKILSLKPKEKVEDFDASINAKLRDVLLRVEEETMDVTRLRREIPSRAKEAYKSIVSQTDMEITQILEETESEFIDKNSEEENIMNSIENIDELANEYEKHILRLQQLKNSIPERKAELSRLQETINFLEDAYNKQKEEEAIFQI